MMKTQKNCIILTMLDWCAFCQRIMDVVMRKMLYNQYL